MKKYDVNPEWFEKQVIDALSVADASVVEKLCFHAFVNYWLFIESKMKPEPKRLLKG